MRHNDVHGNVAGIELENSVNGVMYANMRTTTPAASSSSRTGPERPGGGTHFHTTCSTTTTRELRRGNRGGGSRRHRHARHLERRRRFSYNFVRATIRSASRSSTRPRRASTSVAADPTLDYNHVFYNVLTGNARSDTTPPKTRRRPAPLAIAFAGRPERRTASATT